MTKAKAEIRHTKRRCQERYGIKLSKEDCTKLAEQIRLNKAIFLERQSNRVTIWEITLPDGQKARAAYDKHRKNIITVLPSKDSWSQRVLYGSVQ